MSRASTLQPPAARVASTCRAHGGNGNILYGAWGSLGAREQRADLPGSAPVLALQLRMLQSGERQLRLAAGHIDVGAKRNITLDIGG
jgi:hypothetical protein